MCSTAATPTIQLHTKHVLCFVPHALCRLHGCEQRVLCCPSRSVLTPLPHTTRSVACASRYLLTRSQRPASQIRNVVDNCFPDHLPLRYCIEDKSVHSTVATTRSSVLCASRNCADTIQTPATQMRNVAENSVYDLNFNSDLSLGRLFWYRKYDNAVCGFLHCVGELATKITMQDPR